MKYVFCTVSMFDLHQRIYVVDAETGKKKESAIVMLDSLAEGLAAVGNNQHINRIVLNGNKEFANEIATQVLEYSKKYYSNDEMKVEVI